MANELICGFWQGDYKYPEDQLGQRGCRMGPEMGWAGRSGPILAPASSQTLLMSSGTFHLLHVGPWRQFLRNLGSTPCPASFNISCPGPQSFLPFQFGPWATWIHVHFVS
jgi:hypothetical protein